MTHYRISIPITKQSYQIDKMVERAYAMSSNQWHTFFALYTHIQFRLRSFSISIAVDRAFVALFCFLIYERQTSYNFQPSKSYLLNFEKVCEKKYICMKCRRLKELKSPFAWDEHAADWISDPSLFAKQ